MTSRQTIQRFDNFWEMLKMHDIHADLTEKVAKKLQGIMSKAVPIAQKAYKYKVDHNRHMFLSGGMKRKL